MKEKNPTRNAQTSKWVCQAYERKVGVDSDKSSLAARKVMQRNKKEERKTEGKESYPSRIITSTNRHTLPRLQKNRQQSRPPPFDPRILRITIRGAVRAPVSPIQDCTVASWHRETEDDRRPYDLRTVRQMFLEQIELSLWPVLFLHYLETESPQSYPSLAHLAVQEQCVAFMLRRIGGKYRCRGESNRDTRRGE